MNRPGGDIYVSTYGARDSKFWDRFKDNSHMTIGETLLSVGARLDPEELALPPSLAAKPNIAWEHQTLNQLREERAYWQAQIESATGWGAGLVAADNFRKACEAWIRRREAEQ